jgi:hypothetical protein
VLFQLLLPMAWYKGRFVAMRPEDVQDLEEEEDPNNEGRSIGNVVVSGTRGSPA